MKNVLMLRISLPLQIEHILVSISINSCLIKLADLQYLHASTQYKQEDIRAKKTVRSSSNYIWY